ncbi:MAG: hypothetical protein JWM71_2044, partial [Solirubrobacteraceae bacterium]|nr:hypothetical protein [Solirubrobacteraceae bacterium]
MASRMLRRALPILGLTCLALPASAGAAGLTASIGQREVDLAFAPGAA